MLAIIYASLLLNACHHLLDVERLFSGRMRVMAAAVEDTDKSLRELNSDDFYPFLEGAGERLVVVDFYTDW